MIEPCDECEDLAEHEAAGRHAAGDPRWEERWRRIVSGSTLTLTNFLLARIAEDEEAADYTHRDGCEHQGVCNCGYPDRVVAESKAKRHIVTLMGYVRESWKNKHAGGGRVLWDDINRREKSHAFTILGELASVYSDHPDYREEWRT